MPINYVEAVENQLQFLEHTSKQYRAQLDWAMKMELSAAQTKAMTQGLFEFLESALEQIKQIEPGEE
jgi:flagellar biosynthesis chaperone FliJ